MTLPNFFIIGPARCATTALYDYLSQHPQIYMSPIKEPNFFVFYGRGIDYCGPGDKEWLAECYVPSLQAYEAQFAGVREENAVGEASPWYLYLPEVAGRIRRHVPEARIIAMLRDPVDRAYSAFATLRLRAREPERDFLRAVKLEPGRIAAHWEPLWHYLSMGMYYEQVRRYFDHFGRNQVRVYVYEDFDRAPQPIIADMLRFLGVDDSFVPDMSERPNQSRLPKNQNLHTLLAQRSSAKSVVRRFVPSILRIRVRTSLWDRNLTCSGAPLEARRRLIEYVREDVLRLEQLLDRDFSAWLRCEPASECSTRSAEQLLALTG